MRNVEAKFWLRDPARVLERALELGFSARGEFSQRDTFFATSSGKLKLREEASGAALIFYRRSRIEALQLSDYEIVPILEPARTRAMMAQAFGVLAELTKRRTLLTRGHVRLHIDRVDGLGEFGEIEAVLGEGDSEQVNREQTARLTAELGIAAEDLIEVSYFELTAKR